MSILCPRCNTRWLLIERKCPTCGADTNGRLPRSGAAFSLQPPQPDPPYYPPSAEPYSPPPAPEPSTYSSGGGGDFSGGGGGSDF